MNQAAPGKPAAFILTGSFLVVCRAPRYFAELSRRRLKILLATPASWREEALACMAEPGHPAAAIDEIAFVEGGVDKEGSFIAGAVSAAGDWRERYSIVGVYAVGETLVEPTGLLGDALGLPSPGLRASRACRSKYLQRWYLPEFSPRSTTVPAGGRGAFSPDGVTFPAVVKPASRHSSSGVVTVGDVAELSAQLTTYPEYESVLVESKVTGQEFSVESLVQNGKVIFASVTRKETSERDGRTFVELSHTVPSDRPASQEVLLTANERLLDRLAMENGITHSEWRVDEAGRPFLMEVAARTPGDGLSVLYELATGAAWEAEIIRIALGEHADYPQPRRHARQVYLEHPIGTLAEVVVDWPGVIPTWVGEAGIWPDIEPGAADDPPALRAVFVLKDRGSRLGPLDSSEDRAVTFFIDAPTISELDELDRQVRRAITISVCDRDAQPEELGQ